jgi:hypothetical protein
MHNHGNRQLNRRAFVQTSALVAGGLLTGCATPAKPPAPGTDAPPSLARLPEGSAPAPVAFPHFPSRLHAFVWRNWSLVPVDRMAAVVGAQSADLRRLGQAMGLGRPPRITRDQQRRSYISVIKRNWHLLPYGQLLLLLGWTPDQLAYTLREDDFLYVKLGNLKPRCEPLRYAPSDQATRAREAQIARIVRETFPDLAQPPADPLFGFVSHLSSKPADTRSRAPQAPGPLRFCYSYFALYGDPLLEPDADPFPEGYLARLAAVGVNGVWLQAVLYKLAPFPWDAAYSQRYAERLENLRALVARARTYGLGIYLYLNEPRAMPLAFYASRPELKGVVEGDHAALCASAAPVRKYLVEAIASVCRAVPGLAGFFTITASENLTNCWSHFGGARCPRCRQRPPADVIADVHRAFAEGIQLAGHAQQLIAWDWGWADDWAEAIINRLPSSVALMSVSEWSIPIRRGGVDTTVGEYSISVIGPGPRARRHWAWARNRGLKTLAKIQAGNTWELSAVPYIPAVENVARHAAQLSEARVDGLMLGWTLGGYPSPNLEVAAQIRPADSPSPGPAPGPEAVALSALDAVARRRFGATLAPLVVQAWRECSAAFGEFPYHGGLVYSAPLQVGPANLLWAKPTGYPASMVGFPYDDLDGWRAVYPPEVFAAQLEKVAGGFERAVASARETAANLSLTSQAQVALRGELAVAAAAAIHFRSAAQQARFILARRALAAAPNAAAASEVKLKIQTLLKAELELARRLHALQSADSRIGFEAANHYYYIPLDLVEKVLNCRHLLATWAG